MRIVALIVLAGLAALVIGCRSEQAGTAAKIAWVTSPDEAFAQAKQAGKPLMMDISAEWCGSCQKLDKDVWSRSDVAELSTKFVAAKIDGDKYPQIPKQYSISGYPTTIFFSASGKEIGRVRGAAPYEDMMAEMNDALQKAEASK